MISAVLAASVVTLYCDVSFSSNGEPPTPSDQRVFTVDYDRSEIYVVAGDRKGQVLKAKTITPTTIEFPDFTTLDRFKVADATTKAGGTERIDRLTGEYRSQTFMIMRPVINRTFEHKGRCAQGALVAMPRAQF